MGFDRNAITNSLLKYADKVKTLCYDPSEFMGGVTAEDSIFDKIRCILDTCPIISVSPFKYDNGHGSTGLNSNTILFNGVKLYDFPYDVADSVGDTEVPFSVDAFGTYELWVSIANELIWIRNIEITIAVGKYTGIASYKELLPTDEIIFDDYCDTFKDFLHDMVHYLITGDI